MKNRPSNLFLLFLLAILALLTAACNPAMQAAMQAVPIRAAAQTQYGTIGYSSKSGVSLLVDLRSGK